MGMLVGAVLVGAGVVVDEHATTPIANSPSGMARDVLVLTQLSAALTDYAGADAHPTQLDRTVIERFLTSLTEQGYPLIHAARAA